MTNQKRGSYLKSNIVVNFDLGKAGESWGIPQGHRAVWGRIGLYRLYKALGAIRALWDIYYHFTMYLSSKENNIVCVTSFPTDPFVLTF